MSVSEHPSSIELSRHRQIEIDRGTLCTSGSCTSFLHEFSSSTFASVSWTFLSSQCHLVCFGRSLRSQLIDQVRDPILHPKFHDCWDRDVLDFIGFVAIAQDRQDAFELWVRGAVRQSRTLSPARPYSGISAVVNELVASFHAWNRQHLLGVPKIYGSEPSFE